MSFGNRSSATPLAIAALIKAPPMTMLRVDHVARLDPILVEKPVPQAVSGVGAQDIDRLVPDQVEQVLDAIFGEKVSLDGANCGAQNDLLD